MYEPMLRNRADQYSNNSTATAASISICVRNKERNSLSSKEHFEVFFCMVLFIYALNPIVCPITTCATSVCENQWFEIKSSLRSCIRCGVSSVTGEFYDRRFKKRKIMIYSIFWNCVALKQQSCYAHYFKWTFTWYYWFQDIFCSWRIIGLNQCKFFFNFGRRLP